MTENEIVDDTFPSLLTFTLTVLLLLITELILLSLQCIATQEQICMACAQHGIIIRSHLEKPSCLLYFIQDLKLYDQNKMKQKK